MDVNKNTGLPANSQYGVPPDGEISPLRKRMIQDMELAGLSLCTQKTYIASVKALQKHYGIRPDRLPEQKVYQYLIWLRCERKVAKGTFQTQLYGLKYFYYRFLGFEWNLFTKKKIRLPKKFRLPQPINKKDCQRLLKSIHKPHYRLCCATMYTLGLRVNDAITLRIDAIDSQEMTIRIIGKGNKERIVPIPKGLFLQWRSFWKTHRHKIWIFPNQIGTGPMCYKSLSRALYHARDSLGLSPSITLHCLRHSFATHLRENGVDMSAIQVLLGHASIRSTQIYAHFTKALQDNVRKNLEDLFNDAFEEGEGYE